MWSDVVFDLYGTLVDIHTDEQNPALWAKMAEHYRLFGADYDSKELHAAYDALVQQQEQGLRRLRQDAHEAHPEIQIEEVFARLFEEKGVEANRKLVVRTSELFRRESTEYIHLYDGAEELLRTLRTAGKRLWLLSNAQAVFTRFELSALGLTNCFDGIYLSSDYGVKKPDSSFFRILLEAEGIIPTDAVMVGNDGICDILGAQQVGMSAIYIRSNISPAEPLPAADVVLEEMDLRRVKTILLKK